MSEFLSQDEVDSLLRGVTGETEEEDDSDEAEAGEVRSYDLASQERIVRGRMPTMEIINERFSRLFRIGLFNMIRRTPEVSVGPVRVLKFGEFVRNLHVPTNLNIVQAPPLRGNGLFVFDPNLIFQIVDNLFGGDGRFHTRVEGREFTQTEQRIIHNILEVAFQTYSESWSKVSPLTFEFVRSEMNPQFANIATPNEVVIVTTFDIELSGNGGSFHICVPYSMLEPLKDLLFNNIHGEHQAADKRWMDAMSRQIPSAVVELIAILGESRITLDQVAKMRVGDVIQLEANDTVTAYVDQIPVFNGKYGIHKRQYAIKIDNILTRLEGEE